MSETVTQATDDAKKTVRQLIGEMDAKFTRWDIWRTAMGDWHLKAEQATQLCEIAADGFVEALSEALQWRSLPLVPRPKERLYRDGFETVKNGRKWRLRYHGRDCYTQADKKADLEAYADRQVALSISETDSWESMYGWSRSATEGVDFRYAR